MHEKTGAGKIERQGLDLLLIFREKKSRQIFQAVLAGNRAGGMPGPSVADLVGDDTGKLIFIVDKTQKPGMHINRASGNGEGVRRFIIRDIKMIREIFGRKLLK